MPATGRLVWALGWSSNRSHSYGEGEAQAQASLTKSAPR